MKIISTWFHGILDYAVASFIIVMPWIFDFANGGAQTWILVASGTTTILYSLVTQYEFSVAKVIPFSFHLFLDSLSGLVIASSPWLFGFYDSIQLPHLIIGLMEITVVILSKKSSRLLNKKHHAKY